MSSIRQQIAVKKLSEIIGNSKGQKNISMGRILREAGYSDETSKTPQLVTKTKGFKEELNKVISTTKLIDALVSLVDASELKKFSFEKSLSDENITKILNNYKVVDISRENNHVYCRYWSPDYTIRFKALDMVFKLKNLYQSNKTEQESKQSIVIKLVQYGTKNKTVTE